jgi:hypothetical protein
MFTYSTLYTVHTVNIYSIYSIYGAIEVDQECAERGVLLDNARVRRVLQAITQQV